MDGDPSLRQIKQGLARLRQGLEELESAMIEFEENLSGQSSVRPQERSGLDLLSIPEVCQELGMGKSWLYSKLKSGEIPSIKLGSKIKIKRGDLEEYLKEQAVRPPQHTVGQVTDQVQGAVGLVGQVAHGMAEGIGGAAQQAQDNAGEGAEHEKEPNTTPAAKKKAEELGIDLLKVQGTGPGGRIKIGDVRRAAQKG